MTGSAAVRFNDGSGTVVGFLPAPIALKLEQHLDPTGHRRAGASSRRSAKSRFYLPIFLGSGRHWRLPRIFKTHDAARAMTKKRRHLPATKHDRPTRAKV